MAADVTRAQRAMLILLNPGSKRTRAQWWVGEDMLRMLYDHRTTQGVHQTAASLVRRGCLEKRLGGASEKVYYRITDKGREMVAALASLDKAANS
jgi:DNA-binding MarR family transcriptional regulator